MGVELKYYTHVAAEIKIFNDGANWGGTHDVGRAYYEAAMNSVLGGAFICLHYRWFMKLLNGLQLVTFIPNWKINKMNMLYSILYAPPNFTYHEW